jgi:hypothetical protein
MLGNCTQDLVFEGTVRSKGNIRIKIGSGEGSAVFILSEVQNEETPMFRDVCNDTNDGKCNGIQNQGEKSIFCTQLAYCLPTKSFCMTFG